MAEKKKAEKQKPETQTAASPPPGTGVWWVLGGMFGGWAVGVFVALRMFSGDESAQPWVALAFVFVGIFVGAFLGWRREAP
jgi:hypothetical protein